MRVAYVNVFVSELERALAFYRDALGFALEHADAEHGYASLDAGGIRLGLAVAPPDQEGWLGRHTGVGLAVEDLESEHARLAALGVRFAMPPTRQPWGGFMAILEDPDGNLLYLDEVLAAHA